MDQVGLVALSSGICMAGAVLGGAYSQGRMAAAALEGIARNPNNSAAAVRAPLLIALAMTESLVLFGMVIAYGLTNLASSLAKG
jgi:F-type H+-transporting ATPase subunit c